MKWIKYSYRQKISLALLITIIFGTSVYRYIDHRRFISLEQKTRPVEITWFSEEIPVAYRKHLNTVGEYKKEGFLTSKGSSSTRKALFSFDPNFLSPDSLALLGLSKFALRNLLKYRENGGKFYNKESLLKVYGIDSTLYFRLKDSIDIKVASNPVRKKFEYPSYKTYPKAQEKEAQRIELNQASEEDFKKLKGIGEKLSKRLVKYRESLGGYSSTDQIKEIYGLSEETYDAILPQLILNEHQIRKIPINTVIFKDLLKHPYSDYELTKQLINYRNSHGPFNGKEELNKIYLIDGEKLKKLLPYLSFDTVEIQTVQDTSRFD